MSTPKPKPPPTKAPLVQPQKTSATQNPSHHHQQRPVTPSGQATVRSATPTGSAAKTSTSPPTSTKGSPSRPSTPVKEPHTTWTPVLKLKQLIPRGLKSAPAVPPPAAGQPFKWKFPKAPPVK